MAEEFIYQMMGVEKVLPTGRRILHPTWLSFYTDAKIGVIGHNGAGKSTVLRIMAGLDEAYGGKALIRAGATVGMLPQEPALDPSLDVRGNIELGLKGLRALLEEYEALSMRFAEPLSDDEMNALLEQQGAVQDRIDAANAWELESMVDVAMDALRVPAGDLPVAHLSGGERRRVALCRLLLERPDLLLLDEPTNHLDAESVAWLERHLGQYPGCVICVTHDRYFMENVAHWVLELDHGKAYPYQGNYSGWLEQKEERLRQEQKAESRRQQAIAQELAWVRSSPRARQAKSRARYTAYDALVAAEADKRRATGARIAIPLSRRLGTQVVKAEGLRKAYGDKLLFDDLSFELPAGGIVGVIGPNGAGKTTLFRMLVGEERPDAGTLTISDTVDLGYVDQARDTLNDANTVWQEISEGRQELEIGGRTVNSRAYVAAFNFAGADQQQELGSLSGGERNRVHLAKLLRRGCNLLLLDEPTNDLDVETLRNLEEAIEDFPGCALIISHDRWFLDRIATHILAFEGDSRVVWFEGNYQDYERDRKKRLGADADQPHRIKYRKLTR
ncbi:MAG: energy-dependent translational throttle protein EttA [Pseudomonadota bacterium]